MGINNKKRTEEVHTTFYVHYILLYNILTSIDGVVRRMFSPSRLFWTSDYTFRDNKWTSQPGSHRRKATQDFFFFNIYIYIL